MEIIGREEEVEIMDKLLDSNTSEFLAMYGRRRIGKTYLIRQFYQKQLFFECSGLHENEMPQQLENFYLCLLEQFPTEEIKHPKTWLQAFSILKKLLQKKKSAKKKVIFLDEIAWFETPRSGFLAALDSFWNQFCSKRNDIILVICGSAASWIINKVINNKGGLHNRITAHIQLMPFTLKETKAFLEKSKVKLNEQDIAKIYMAIGGVPYYLKDIQAGQSVVQIIDSLFFKAQATLKNEFGNLYASLFNNSDLHVKIVRALAKKNKGLTRQELLDATKLSSGGGFSLIIRELHECGFIKTIQPIDKNKEDFLYRLVDEYTIFYFKFIEKNKTKSNWTELSNTQSYKIWTGFAFENLCFKHVPQLKKALGISGIISKEYSWILKGKAEEKGSQIDFIIDRSDNCINLLEVKFHEVAFEMTKLQATQIKERMYLFKDKIKSKKNIFITLLTANGAKKNEHYLSCVTNELKLRDLFL